MGSFQAPHGRYLDLSTVRVLMVEDNAPMRRILKTVLSGIGIVWISEARTADEAAACLKTSSFDLIFLDEVLDDARGWTVAKQIRNGDGPNRGSPIIMVSGNAHPHIVAQARDSGVDEFVVKPLSVGTLAQRVEAALTRQRAFVDGGAYKGPDRRRRRQAEYAGAERRRR